MRRGGVLYNIYLSLRGSGESKYLFIVYIFKGVLENIRGKLYLGFNGDAELFYLGVIYKGVTVAT